MVVWRLLLSTVWIKTNGVPPLSSQAEKQRICSCSLSLSCRHHRCFTVHKSQSQNAFRSEQALNIMTHIPGMPGATTRATVWTDRWTACMRSDLVASCLLSSLLCPLLVSFWTRHSPIHPPLVQKGTQWIKGICIASLFCAFTGNNGHFGHTLETEVPAVDFVASCGAVVFRTSLQFCNNITGIIRETKGPVGALQSCPKDKSRTNQQDTQQSGTCSE